MTPLHFEQTYQDEWTELEAADRSHARPEESRRERGRVPPGKFPTRPAVRAARAAGRTAARSAGRLAAHERVRLAALYRRACEHLALARARAYPAYIVDRLERVTADAHQLIYHRREFRFAQLRDLALVAFPRAVRAHWRYVAVSAAAFLLPTIVIGLLVYMRPEFILSVLNQETASQFEEMYSPNAQAIGRRTASTDWMMFGYYIRNNIGVSFQCFAGGLFAGARLAVLPRLQRRVRRRDRRLSHRARLVLDVLFVRRDPLVVRADRHRPVRRGGPAHRPRAARAGTSDAAAGAGAGDVGDDACCCTG